MTILDGKTPIGTATADPTTGVWSAPGGGSAVSRDETATATNTGGTGPASGHWYLGTAAGEPIVGTAGADTFVGNGGNDKLAGGAGDDRFQFQNAQLTSGVTVSGGAGTDAIQITDKAVMADAAFNGVRTVEQLLLGNFAGQSVTLAANAKVAATSAGRLTIDASSDAQSLSVDASLPAFAGAHLNVTGGSGDDVFSVNRARLALHDKIAGGSGNDTVKLVETAAVTLQDTDLAGLSGIEALTVQGAAANITLAGYAATMLASAAGNTLAVNAGTSSALTVDASLLADAAGHVNFTGGTGVDSFLLSAARFNAGDTIAAGTGADTVQIADVDPVVIGDSAFTKVSGLEKLVLTAVSADITLGSAAAIAIASAGGMTIDDSAGAGDFKVNAAGVNNSAAGLTFLANTTVDSETTNTIVGGDGNDLLRVTNAHFRTGVDHFTGGLGSDTLQFTDSNNVLTDADFGALDSVENVKLGSGTANISLGATASAQVGGAGHMLTIDASAANSGQRGCGGHLADGC